MPVISMPKRIFYLLDDKGVEVGVYVGVQPRVAALKAASRGHTNIILREKGTRKLHFFIGKRELVPVPENAPWWLKKVAKKNDGKIFKAKATKIGTTNGYGEDLTSS
jgi:hypothetical protein